MPANADQARIAAQLLIFRELSDTFAKAAQAAGLPFEHMCRLGRTASGLARTAIELDRSLARHQQNPAPIFGTVDDHGVDLAAVDAMWGGHPGQLAEPPPASPPRQPPRDATPPPTEPDPAPTNPSPPTPETRTAPSPHPQPDQPPQPDHAGGAREWTITKLDEGPGWSREGLRHRSSPARSEVP
jgi:outer membrane biosynthesis protein TonB